METIKKSNGKSSSRLSKCIMFIDKFILEVILLKSKVNIALKLKKKNNEENKSEVGNHFLLKAGFLGTDVQSSMFGVVWQSLCPVGKAETGIGSHRGSFSTGCGVSSDWSRK